MLSLLVSNVEEKENVAKADLTLAGGAASAKTVKTFHGGSESHPKEIGEKEYLLRELENNKELCKLQEEEIKSLAAEKRGVAEGKLGDS